MQPVSRSQLTRGPEVQVYRRFFALPGKIVVWPPAHVDVSLEVLDRAKTGEIRGYLRLQRGSPLAASDGDAEARSVDRHRYEEWVVEVDESGNCHSCPICPAMFIMWRHTHILVGGQTACEMKRVKDRNDDTMIDEKEATMRFAPGWNEK
jgi:hypothetical protein